MVSRRLFFLLLAILSAGLLLILCFSFLNNPLVFDDEPFFSGRWSRGAAIHDV